MKHLLILVALVAALLGVAACTSQDEGDELEMGQPPSSSEEGGDSSQELINTRPANEIERRLLALDLSGELMRAWAAADWDRLVEFGWQLQGEYGGMSLERFGSLVHSCQIEVGQAEVVIRDGDAYTIFVPFSPPCRVLGGGREVDHLKLLFAYLADGTHYIPVNRAEFFVSGSWAVEDSGFVYDMISQLSREATSAANWDDPTFPGEAVTELGPRLPLGRDDQFCSDPATAPTCYDGWPPTSGPRDDPPPPGIYEEPQKFQALVGTMYHGGVVIWHNCGECSKQLAELVQEYLDARFKVVMVPDSTIGPESIAITSYMWKELFPAAEFNSERVRRFLEVHESRYNRGILPRGR